jgi:hypothetical protein
MRSMQAVGLNNIFKVTSRSAASPLLKPICQFCNDRCLRQNTEIFNVKVDGTRSYQCPSREFNRTAI